MTYSGPMSVSYDLDYEKCPRSGCNTGWARGEDDPRDVGRVCRRSDCCLKPNHSRVKPTRKGTGRRT